MVTEYIHCKMGSNFAVCAVILWLCTPSLVRATRANTLKKELQSFLDEMAKKHGYALQLGFKNADMEFAVAAG